MLFTKKSVIREIRATNITNAPFYILLEMNASCIVLDQKTCDRHNLLISPALVGRTLTCSFKSGLYSGISDDDTLLIQSVKKTEVLSHSLNTIPPSKYSVLSRTINLSSFVPGGSVSIQPCPFYRFMVNLTEDEYEECVRLPAGTIFTGDFQLA